LSNLKLDRAKSDDDPMLARQLLANDIRVAVVAEETLPKPVVQPTKCRPAHGLTIGHNAFSKIAANSVASAAEFLGDPLRSPADSCSRTIAENLSPTALFSTTRASRQIHRY